MARLSEIAAILFGTKNKFEAQRGFYALCI
jgi:hypothetical protein